MLYRHWNRALILGGAFALLAIGAAPAAAAPVNSCPAGTLPYFQSPTVNLGQEGQSSIWSSQVTILAYCMNPGDPTDTSMVLSNVTVTGISMVLVDVPQLRGSIDGSLPTEAVVGSPLPVLPARPGLVTDSSGRATFNLRMESLTEPNLAGPAGAPDFVGLYLDYGTGTGAGWGDDPQGAGLVVASTPELDSLLLFGSGAASLAGYGLLRMRARRRRD